MTGDPDGSSDFCGGSGDSDHVRGNHPSNRNGHLRTATVTIPRTKSASVNTVFHCSTSDSLAITDAKVTNLLGDETVEIESVAVVVDSPTVIDAAAGTHRETVEAVLDAGSEFCVCSNALRGATSSLADLPDGTDRVSSGVGELTRRQNEGAAYIRL